MRQLNEYFSRKAAWQLNLVGVYAEQLPLVVCRYITLCYIIDSDKHVY